MQIASDSQIVKEHLMNTPNNMGIILYILISAMICQYLISARWLFFILNINSKLVHLHDFREQILIDFQSLIYPTRFGTKDCHPS